MQIENFEKLLNGEMDIEFQLPIFTKLGSGNRMMKSFSVYHASSVRYCHSAKEKSAYNIETMEGGPKILIEYEVKKMVASSTSDVTSGLKRLLPVETNTPP
jgi:hypothetical protein